MIGKDAMIHLYKQPVNNSGAAVVFEIFIEDMCRKTSYTGNGQTKISDAHVSAFICDKFNKPKPNCT